MENINYIEWDSKHKQYLIRLAGDAESQEIRLNKMKASEDLYEALKQAHLDIEVDGEVSITTEGIIDKALAKVEK